MSLKCVAVAAMLIFSAIMLQAEASQADMVWDPELGWVDMSLPVEGERGHYGYAKGLLIRGDVAAARTAFDELEKRFPAGEYVAKARLGRAESEIRLGRPAQASRILQELMMHPGSVDQGEIARLLIETARMTADKTAAKELMGIVIAKAPSAQQRLEAQMVVATCDYEAGKYAEAAREADVCVENALTVEGKREALLLAGRSYMALSRKGGGVEEALESALNCFNDYISADAAGTELEKAQEYVWLIESLKNESDSGKRALYYEAARVLESPESADTGAFKSAAKKYKGEAVGETAKYYLGECLFLRGEGWAAFKVFEEFLKTYPSSRRSRSAIGREFEIGRQLAEKSISKAERVMTAVAENNPLGPLADDAYMTIGRMYLDNARYVEARGLFDLVMQTYPKSEWAGAAIYFGGVADVRLSEWSSDRMALLARARNSFELYLRDAPDGTFAEDARVALADCGERQARVMMEVANFYERRKEHTAAEIYLREILKEFPESGAASDVVKMNREGRETREERHEQ